MKIKETYFEITFMIEYALASSKKHFLLSNSSQYKPPPITFCC